MWGWKGGGGVSGGRGYTTRYLKLRAYLLRYGWASSLAIYAYRPHFLYIGMLIKCSKKNVSIG